VTRIPTEVKSIGESNEVANKEELPELFGIKIGSKFSKTTKDYIYVQEGPDGNYFTRRHVSNPDYIVQGVAITKLSSVIFKVNGTMKASDACAR